MTAGYYRLPDADGTPKYCQNASEVWRIARKEISLSFLGREVSSLLLTALWGPRAPRAWVLGDGAPVTLACHPLFSWGTNGPSQKGKRNLCTCTREFC